MATRILECPLCDAENTVDKTKTIAECSACKELFIIEDITIKGKVYISKSQKLKHTWSK